MGSKMKERLHTGEIYYPNDDEIMQEQFQCQEKMYDYNSTRPSEGEKRTKLLQEMFAEIGENCYIDMPVLSVPEEWDALLLQWLHLDQT